jgi:hypothetical protein
VLLALLEVALVPRVLLVRREVALVPQVLLEAVQVPQVFSVPQVQPAAVVVVPAVLVTLVPSVQQVRLRLESRRFCH